MLLPALLHTTPSNAFSLIKIKGSWFDVTSQQAEVQHE